MITQYWIENDTGCCKRVRIMGFDVENGKGKTVLISQHNSPVVAAKKINKLRLALPPPEGK